MASRFGRPASRNEGAMDGVAESTQPSWEQLNAEVKRLRRLYDYPREDDASGSVVCYTIALQDGLSRVVRVAVPAEVFKDGSAMLTEPDLHACTLEKVGQEMLALALRGGQ